MNDDSICALHKFNESLPPNAVRIFRVDTTVVEYVVFSPWAETLAESINVPLRDCNTGSETQTMYTAFTEDILKESVLDALPESSVVEIYADQTLVKRGSAQDKQILDDLIFRTDFSTIGLRFEVFDHLNEQTVHVSCAYANLSLRTIGVTSFYDQKGTFRHLKAFLCIAEAREVILEVSDQKTTRASRSLPANAQLRAMLSEDDCSRLEGIFARYDMQVIGAPSTDPSWKITSATQMTQTVCNHKSISPQWLTDCPSEIAVVGALIDYLQLAHEECNFGQYKLKNVPLDSCMAIDENAVEALHLFKSAYNTSEKSVFAILEEFCCTKMGSRLLRYYLSQPLRNIEEINYRLDMVTVFVEDDFLREAISRNVLQKAPDVDMLLKRFQRRQGSLKDVRALQTFLDAILELSRILNEYKGAHAELIENDLASPLKDMAEAYQRLTSLITQILEDADPYGYSVRIRPQFDQALSTLDKDRSAVLTSIEDEYKTVLKENGWSDKSVKLEAISHDNYALRITRKDDKLIRGRPDLSTVQTLKDSVRFVSATLRNLNASLKSVTQEYEARQQAIETKLLEIVWTYRPVLDDGNDCISKIDAFNALGTMVIRSRQSFCRPTFDDSQIRLTGVRHFILGQTMDAVGNDISFAHFDDQSRQFCAETEIPDAELYVMTGPNMGGKSTLMRAVALTIILAQIGSYVPCTAAQICIRDAVLTRVGANDSILHGLSTFMIEMQETNHILANATKDSFVIIDELGRGTSTYDGFGIAYAIAEHIAKEMHCFTMLSTHYHEMTYLSENLPKGATLVQNVYMSASCSDNDIHFPYKLLPGAVLKSFGLHVAKMSGFPEKVLETAEEKASVMEMAMNRHAWENASLKGDASTESSEDACPVVLLASYLQDLAVHEDPSKVMRNMHKDAEKYPILGEALKRIRVKQENM